MARKSLAQRKGLYLLVLCVILCGWFFKPGYKAKLAPIEGTREPNQITLRALNVSKTEHDILNVAPTKNTDCGLSLGYSKRQEASAFHLTRGESFQVFAWHSDVDQQVGHKRLFLLSTQSVFNPNHQYFAIPIYLPARFRSSNKSDQKFRHEFEFQLAIDKDQIDAGLFEIQFVWIQKDVAYVCANAQKILIN
jgi:hypothetical protein